MAGIFATGSHYTPNITQFEIESIYGDKSWKRRLFDAYNGLKGKALSKAIAKDGYDGVITVSTYKGKPVETSEIVDLRMFRKK